jgi:hypothetical protein
MLSQDVQVAKAADLLRAYPVADREIEEMLDKAERAERDIALEIEQEAFADLEYDRQAVDQWTIYPSEFVSFAIMMPMHGEMRNFSFEGRNYLKPIYNSDYRRQLLCFSRQSEKSTYLGNTALTYASLIVGFKVLYVTATTQQAMVFSADRIRAPMEMSEVISSLVSARLSQNVFFKQLRNHSQIRIRYAFHNADRVRGISSDMNLLDELQDILVDNIPIIAQCSSHSDYRYEKMSGTPKSVDNTMAVYWNRYSTQNEWAIPCERHTPIHWNTLGMKNIGKKGPICDRCGGYINPAHPKATWVSFQPRTEQNRDRVTYDGYRICQLMVPWVVQNEDEWREKILFPLNSYSKSAYFNEILALSSDSGEKPITQAQLQACCDPSIRMADSLKHCRNGDYSGVSAGIDWGTSEGSSHTVLSLGAYLNGLFTIFFCYRFEGRESDVETMMAMLMKFLDDHHVNILGTDYGGGFDRNDRLARRYGKDRVKKYQYVWRQKKKIKWEPGLGRFTVFRTEVMQDLFNALRQAGRVIRLPAWEDFQEPFAEDILNIFKEYSTTMNMDQFQRTPGKPDDTFHSILCCLLASMITHPRPDIIIPIEYDMVGS